MRATKKHRVRLAQRLEDAHTAGIRAGFVRGEKDATDRLKEKYEVAKQNQERQRLIGESIRSFSVALDAIAHALVAVAR
jgi:hypothetical protein